MGKPFKLRDNGTGNLRTHQGKYAQSGVPVQKLAADYRNGTPVPLDSDSGTAGDVPNAYGPAPAVKKPFKAG